MNIIRRNIGLPPRPAIPYGYAVAMDQPHQQRLQMKEKQRPQLDMRLEANQEQLQRVREGGAMRLVCSFAGRTPMTCRTWLIERMQ